MMKEGQSSEFVLVLVSGKVRVYWSAKTLQVAEADGSGRKPPEYFGVGSIIGESDAATDSPLSFSAVSESAVEVYKLKKEDFVSC